jgi:NADH:ubiquinone oxidoreductase subunit 3 (subunit A)
MISDQVSLFASGCVFLAVLAVAFVYEWRKGALDWNR